MTSLSFLLPGKALGDQSNEEIRCLWSLRAQLDDRVKDLNQITAAELDLELVVEITDAQSVAAPDISHGAEGPYAEWSEAAAKALCVALDQCVASSAIPNTLPTRILNGQWIDLFRVAFREELKRDEDAETAYFIRAHPESPLNLVLVRFMTSIHQAWDAPIPNL